MSEEATKIFENDDQSKKIENSPKIDYEYKKTDKQVLKITSKENSIPKTGKRSKKDHLTRIYNKDFTPSAQYKLISTWKKNSDSNKKMFAYFVKKKKKRKSN